MPAELSKVDFSARCSLGRTVPRFVPLPLGGRGPKHSVVVSGIALRSTMILLGNI
jgi:hypothetical protein